MFCGNCGREIPDGAKFCTYCGARQAEPPAQEPEQPVKREPEAQFDAPEAAKSADKFAKQRKIGLGIVIVLAVFMCVYLIIDASHGGGDLNVVEQIEQRSDDASPEYLAIFDGTGITHVAPVKGKTVESYASIDENGMISCTDYVCSGDTVTSFAETIYLPASGYTDEEKAELDRTVKASLSELERLSCTELSYEFDGDYYVVTVIYYDVDNGDVLNELAAAGLAEGSDDSISMSATEESIVAAGYVKK